jgi:hypothetical protein
MLKTISVFLAFVCFYATPCLATEASDALELLSISLKCPIPTIRIWGSRGAGVYQETTKFVGNASLLSLETDTRGASYAAKTKALAAFKDLGFAVLGFGGGSDFP